MMNRLLRRMTDEESVQKLVQEAFVSLWFKYEDSREAAAQKTLQLRKVVEVCLTEGGIDQLEDLFVNVLKDKNVREAGQQMVDCLMNMLVELEEEEGSEGEGRRECCMTAVALFAKADPSSLEKHTLILQHFLSTKPKTLAQQKIVCQVIMIFEKVLPVLDHPGDRFLKNVEGLLAGHIEGSNMAIVQVLNYLSSHSHLSFRLRFRVVQFVQSLEVLTGTWRSSVSSRKISS